MQRFSDRESDWDKRNERDKAAQYPEDRLHHALKARHVLAYLAELLAGVIHLGVQCIEFGIQAIDSGVE